MKSEWIAVALASLFAVSIIWMPQLDMPTPFDPIQGDTRGFSSGNCFQTDHGCVDYKHILDEIACAERYWMPDDEGDMGTLEFLTGAEEQVVRNWAWDGVDRGYFESGFLEGRTTGKFHEYMYSLNQSTCIDVLTQAGVPGDTLLDDENTSTGDSDR